MKLNKFFHQLLTFTLLLVLSLALKLKADEQASTEVLTPAPEEGAGVSEAEELKQAKEALKSMKEDEDEGETPKAAGKKKKSDTKYYRRAEGFVAKTDWEFDGFVSGGQDQNIKSLFSVNDLLYLNIGYVQGLASGDKLGVYRRGEKIRDPQTGKFLGYEVRKVAVSEVTDRLDENTCSVRITKSFESVELGDLVRREGY